MSYNNLAFTTPERPDGTWLVIATDRHDQRDCPVVVWRDDSRAARFPEANRSSEARWFIGDDTITAYTWGSALVHAVAIYEVDRDPKIVLWGERYLWPNAATLPKDF